MSGGDSQPLKIITVEGRKEPTIEVSGGNSLIDYVASHFKELTYVRTPSNCFPAEREMIIHSCNQFPFLVYESGDKDGDGDDGDDEEEEEKKNEEEEKNEEEGETKKDEDEEKRGEKTRSSCCCN